MLAPFLTAGHVGGVVAGAPWADTDGVEPVGGVAIELFQHLVRAEIAVRFRRGRGGALVDVNRDLWPVL
ncbi:MAG: hypothetical protein A2W29_07285 [Gemmatimonadetes bacterium RBG_16_66_8]|nr:MAG: hypothetical protein A2W29_07285 [Gemmatimonadetes bacterium RBG_16_66_8]